MERIVVRPLEQEDSIPMYLLRCSDDVASISINLPPTSDQHRVFIEQTLAGDRPPIYVAEVDGYYAGSYSVNDKKDVNIMVAAPYRRTGVATALLTHAQGAHDKLVALIHKDNTASLALFIKCGFVPVPDNSVVWRVLVWLKEGHASTSSHAMVSTVL